MTQPLASPGLEATVFLYPDLRSNIPLLLPHSIEVSQLPLQDDVGSIPGWVTKILHALLRPKNNFSFCF